MKKTKEKSLKIAQRILSLALTIVMLTAMAIPAVAELSDIIYQPPEIPEAPKGYKNVVVAMRNITNGTRIGENYLEVVAVNEKNLPPNIISDMTDLIGKYVTTSIYEGEYIYEDMLSSVFKAPIDANTVVAPLEKAEEDPIITVTDYIKPNTGTDMSGAIQKLIDKNPGRTLYFPDGEYLISYPLTTSSVSNSVTSFLLSDGAVIKAHKEWNGIKYRNGLICMGSGVASGGTGAVIRGGTLDGNGKADGIIIESGLDSYVQNVDIVNTRIGIDIRSGVDGGDSRWTISGVDILGTGMVGSVGMKVDGGDNLFENMTIYNMHTAVGLLSSNNQFSNVVINQQVDDEMYSSLSVAFSDSGVNLYRNCTVYNCGVAYQVKSESTLTDCSAIWTNEVCKSQVAIKMSGSLTSVISSFTALFCGKNAKTVVFEGSGNSKKKFFLGWRVNESLADDQRYKKYLATPVVNIDEWGNEKD